MTRYDFRGNSYDYTTRTRDRPGGHAFKTYFGYLDSNLNGGAHRKQINKRLKRRTNNLQIQEGLQDYYEEIQEIKDELKLIWEEYLEDTQDLEDLNDYHDYYNNSYPEWDPFYE